uniref:Putative secreted protein n=1 Tax=Ixodes ricinus TaxID=34613 RepID=A0A6B0UME6_IXORI
MQLLARLVYAVAVSTVHHEYEPLRARVVVPPQGPYLVLSTHVPDVKFDVFVGDCFDVEAHSRNGGDRLAQLELVQNGRFAGCVKTQHQNPHLLVAENFGQELPHAGWGVREPVDGPFD